MPLPGDHHDLHGRPQSDAPSTSWSGSSAPRSASATRAIHAAAREGVAVPPRTPGSTPRSSGAPTCRSPRCSTVWSGTCGSPAVATPAPRPQVRGHLRHLLERPRRSCPTTLTATPNCSTERSATGSGAQPAPSTCRPRGPAAARTRSASSRRSTPSGVHGRHRNLVVAATGTGKTVVAALDYRRLGERPRRPPPAVRRTPQGDPRAGPAHLSRGRSATERSASCYVGGRRPRAGRHVFASVQSLHADGSRTPAGHFDVVVIDEFHHAGPPTYRRAARPPQAEASCSVSPPRRNAPTASTCTSCFDGRTADELRLWDALDPDLLVPVPLLRRRRQRRPHRHRVEARPLRRRDARQRSTPATTPARRMVLRDVDDKVTDVHAMRALGFCVSVAHAEYMARVFSDGRHPGAGRLRRDSRGATATMRSRDCATGEVNCLFAVDLFNEGLDLPEVDTVLFLRPTQSATVFLQQLGRGLRRAPGKAVLTVLDFIGQHRREFRFDVRYRALTGSRAATGLDREIEHGFPFLPSGSQLVLDRVAQQIVLDNVRQPSCRLTRAGARRRRPVARRLSLGQYLARVGQRAGRHLQRSRIVDGAAPRGGLPDPASRPGRGRAPAAGRAPGPRRRRERADVYARLADAGRSGLRELTDREQRLARMLFFTLWPDRGGFASYRGRPRAPAPAPGRLRRDPRARGLGLDRARHVPRSLGEGLQHVPLAQPRPLPA